MYQPTAQLIAFNKANLENAVRFMDVALGSTERLFEMQWKTAKGVFADGVQQAKSLTEIKDIQEFSQFKNNLVQPTLDKAAVYAKNVCDLTIETQSEVAALLEKQAATFNKEVITVLDKVVKSAPAGSEVAIAAVKCAISAVNTTYDNLLKSAKQFIEMTQANAEAFGAHVPAKKKA